MPKVELFVVDEQVLPKSREDRTDLEIYQSLVNATVGAGERWSEILIDRADLIDALEAIDQEIGGTKFLPVLALNNSPQNVLGNRPQSPPFGYFDPVQVRDLDTSFGNLSPDAIFDLEKMGPAVADVLYAFQAAAEAAALRGAALSVLHPNRE